MRPARKRCEQRGWLLTSARARRAHQMREKGFMKASSEPRRTWPPPTALNTSLSASRKSSPGQKSALNSATCSSRSSCSTATRRTPAASSCALMPCSPDTSARHSWQPGRRTARMTTGCSRHSSLPWVTALDDASSGLSGASASAAVVGSGTTGAMLARAVDNDAAVEVKASAAPRRASSMQRRAARAAGGTERGGHSECRSERRTNDVRPVRHLSSRSRATGRTSGACLTSRQVTQQSVRGARRRLCALQLPSLEASLESGTDASLPAGFAAGGLSSCSLDSGSFSELSRSGGIPPGIGGAPGSSCGSKMGCGGEACGAPMSSAASSPPSPPSTASDTGS